MRKIGLLSACLTILFAMSSCKGDESVSGMVDEKDFKDVIDGKPVGLYTLKNADVILQATNFGARVVTICTKDKDGHFGDIVLGHNTLEEYVNPMGERFFGACVGPVANRIGGAQFSIGEEIYHTPANDNEANTLHGGYKGLDNVVWDVVEATDTTLTMHFLHPDGFEGYPGNLDIRMKYWLTGNNEFRIDYEAVTDAATYVNISNHPFFCLHGEDAEEGSVEDYELYINASHYVPIDELSIPTGKIARVAATPFDFRKAHSIGKYIHKEGNDQLRFAKGYDHNWCIDKKTDGLELDCIVSDPVSGRQIEVYSDQPGLQIYTGNFFDGKCEGKTGRPINFRSVIALETQHYPDSPNHDNFPSILLEPGDTYTQTCIYRFGISEPHVKAGHRSKRK